MRKFILSMLLVIMLFFSFTAMAIPHNFFINAFGGVSIANKQNGFLLDGNGDRDNIIGFNFGNTAPLVGIGLGYYFYYFSVNLLWSERMSQTSGAFFNDNTGAISPLLVNTRSARLLFITSLYLDALFHQQWRFHPYLQGGVGEAWNQMGTLSLGNQFGVILPNTILITGAARTNFAYQGGVGLATLL